ncbi:hypothetical protein BDW72DRAFT_60084 [Aspergillus terricola var. indicus]
MRPQTVRSLALLGGFSFAAANDIVTLILPAADEQKLVGEVIGSAGSTTTYRIFCPDTVDDDECGMPTNGLTVAAAPTAFVYEYSYEDYYLKESCKHSGTTWFSCLVTNTQSDFSLVTSTTVDEALPYMAVTITSTATGADAEATNTATATSTKTSDADADAETKSSSESPSTTLSGSASVTATPSGSASNTTAADPEETTSDNAAMPQVTGSAAQWIVSGAGMALALALA